MRHSLFDAMLATEDDDDLRPTDEDDDPDIDENEDPDAEESEWDSSVDDGLRIDHFRDDE